MGTLDPSLETSLRPRQLLSSPTLKERQRRRFLQPSRHGFRSTEKPIPLKPLFHTNLCHPKNNLAWAARRSSPELGKNTWAWKAPAELVVLKYKHRGTGPIFLQELQNFPCLQFGGSSKTHQLICGSIS